MANNPLYGQAQNPGSIFAGLPGYKREQSWQYASRQPATLGRDLMPWLRGLLDSQGQFAMNTVEPGRQAALSGLTALLTSKNQQGQAQAAQQGAHSRGVDAARLARNRFGAGSAIGEGAAQEAINRATEGGNSVYTAMSNQQPQNLMMLLQALQGQEMPGLDPFSSIASIIYGSRQPKQPNQTAGLMGGILGGLAGNPGLF